MPTRSRTSTSRSRPDLKLQREWRKGGPWWAALPDARRAPSDELGIDATRNRHEGGDMLGRSAAWSVVAAVLTMVALWGCRRSAPAGRGWGVGRSRHAAHRRRSSKDAGSAAPGRGHRADRRVQGIGIQGDALPGEARGRPGCPATQAPVPGRRTHRRAAVLRGHLRGGQRGAPGRTRTGGRCLPGGGEARSAGRRGGA